MHNLDNIMLHTTVKGLFSMKSFKALLIIPLTKIKICANFYVTKIDFLIWLLQENQLSSPHAVG